MTGKKALVRIEGAYAPSTIRAYQADFGVFATWCASVALSALPARPSTLAWFIEVDAQKSSAATLQRRLAAIRKVHRLFRFQNPIVDEEVLIALRRALRSKFRRPKQALGLTSELRDRLIRACPDTLIGKRNRALIALGYDALCRHAELAGLRVEDLCSDEDGRGATVLIRRAKNDQFGSGRLGYVSEQAYRFVQTWINEARIADGWLFRAVYTNHVGKNAVHPHTINRVLKSAAEAAKLPGEMVEQLSGHSMRIGAAQDLVASGLSLIPIMQAGGWKTAQVVSRYAEKTNLTGILKQARSSGPGSSIRSFNWP